MKSKKNRYYKKILAALLLVNLIPVLFLGGSIVNLVNQQKNALNQTMISQISNQMNEVETSFRYVENAMIRIALSSDTLLALRTDLAAENFQLFNSLRGDLQLIGNSEKQLDDVFLVNKSKNWLIGTAATMPLEEYESLDTVHTLFAMKKHSFWFADGGYLYLVKSLPIYTLNDNALLVARFKKSILDTDSMGGEEGYGTVILNEDGQVIFGDGIDVLVVREVLEGVGNTERLEEGRLINTRYRGESYIMASKTSEYNRWTYIFVATNSAFQRSLSNVMAMLALVVAGMLFVDIFVVYVASKRLYLPFQEIDALVEHKIRAEWEGKKTEEDMELIGKVRYILNKNAELQNIVKNKDESRQQLFLRQLYRGEKIDCNEDTLIKERIISEKLNGAAMYTMALKFKDHFQTEDDHQLCLFALDNVVRELLHKEECFPLVTIGKIIYITCLVDADSNESADIKAQATATMLITAVRKYLHMTINVGVSNGFKQIKDIVPAVEECEKALRDAMGFDGICNFYRYPRREKILLMDRRIHQGRKQVLRAVDTGNKSQCRSELDIYLALLKDTQYCIFKLEISKLISEILNYYEEYALTPDYNVISDILDYDISRKVNSIESLQSYLWDYLLDELFKNICDKAEQKDVIYQIAEYLNENIECDINLEDCARHFNYNASYLSRMFKKNFGKTYTDYVTEKRMERCEELLLETDISINELAERFGYSSTQNFIRVFKKYTLLTPGQFRKYGGNLN